MNTLILNRETFELPTDGWNQIAPIGEFPHAGAGVMQVVDAAASVSSIPLASVTTARIAKAFTWIPPTPGTAYPPPSVAHHRRDRSGGNTQVRVEIPPAGGGRTCSKAKPAAAISGYQCWTW